MTKPLADVRVIALEQYGAAPFGTMQLADLGAEVIKIEDPLHGGDVSRYVPPYAEGTDSLFFESFNRGKASITLDLRIAETRAVFEDLVSCSDAIVSNLRGDLPDRLRLRYADLSTINPRIVCVSLSGFGMTGPRAAEGGYDYTIQALAGWMAVTGGPDEPPTKSGLSIVDYCGGYVAALATLGGIWQARRDGYGCDADLSLFETALAQLTYIGTWVSSRDFTPKRLAHSAHQTVVPFQVFPTADSWIMIACPKQQLWERLCEAIERPDLALDNRFSTFRGRSDNRELLCEILAGELTLRTTEAWLPTLRRHRVPSAPINDVSSALDDDQAAARGAVAEYDHPVLGRVRGPASPLRLPSATTEPVRAPFLGEHTASLLNALCGYDETKLEELANAGVFGPSQKEDA